MPTSARHGAAAFVIVLTCCTAVLAPWRTATAQVAPLTSVTLDETLLAAGFSPEQRAAVLVEHAAYVNRFVGHAEGALSQWVLATGGKHNSEETAREAVRAARAAASAIEAMEQPLYAAILSAATPGQQVSAQRAVDLLAIRLERSLVESAPQEQGLFGMMSSRSSSRDPLAMLERLTLSADQRAAIQPLVDLYIPACRDSLRRERTAAAESPVLRGSSAGRRGPVFEGVATDSQGRPDPDAMRQQLQDILAQAQAQRDAALKDRREASEKSLRAEIALIDGVLPMVPGRDQARLLAEWSRGVRVGAQASPHRLGSAWKGSSERTTEQLAQLDGACATWVQAWWPKAQQVALDAARDSGTITMLGVDQATADAATKRRESMVNATNEAAATIASILGITVDELAAQNRVARGLPGLPGLSIPQDANGEVPAGAVVVMSTLSTASVVGDGGEGMSFTFEGEVPEGAFEDVSGIVGQFDGEMGAISAGIGDVAISLTDASAEGEGFSLPAGITFMANPSSRGRLPRRVAWTQVLPFYVAVGTDEAMLPVGKAMWDTLSDDLEGFFARQKEMLSTGTLAELDSLNAEFVALVTARVSEVNDTIVPAPAQQSAAWIPLWAAGELAPPPSSSGSMAMDPGSVALASELSNSDWLSAGPVLTSVGSALASVNRNARAADARLNRHFEQFQEPGHDGQARAAELADEAQGVWDGIHKSEEAREQAYGSALAQLKATLSAQTAARFQDEIDNRRFRRHLRDPSSLDSRFEKALALALSDSQRQTIESLRASWMTSARAHRDAVVAFLCTHPAPGPGPAFDPDVVSRRDAGLAALTFARDEGNRTALRTLQSALGEELGGNVPPLPAPNSRGPQSSTAFQSFQIGG